MKPSKYEFPIDNLPAASFPSSQFLCLDGLMDGNLKFRPMTLPDRYIEHGTQVLISAVTCSPIFSLPPTRCFSRFSQSQHLVRQCLLGRVTTECFRCVQAEQLAEAGVDASHIAATALAVLGRKKSLAH